MEARPAAPQNRLNEASCSYAVQAGRTSISATRVLIHQATCKSIGSYAVVTLHTGDTPVALIVSLPVAPADASLLAQLPSLPQQQLPASNLARALR